MKWSKKTAQGVSPGSWFYRIRPERAAERVRICNIVRAVFEGFSAVPSPKIFWRTASLRVAGFEDDDEND